MRAVPFGSMLPTARTPPVTRGVKSPLTKFTTTFVARNAPAFDRVISKSMSEFATSAAELAPYDCTTSSGRIKAVGAAVLDASGVAVGPVTFSVAPVWVPVGSTTRTANSPMGEPAGTTAVTVAVLTQVVASAPITSATTTA